MPEIVLYQFARQPGQDSSSPPCTKVSRALAYKKLPYKVSELGNPQELQKLNPGVGKLPVMVYDGKTIPDSTRILEFLEAKHPTPCLFPREGAGAHQTRLLEDWADESLYWFCVYYRWAVDEHFDVFAKALFGGMPIPLRWVVPGFARKKALANLHGQGIGRLSRAKVDGMLEGHLQMLSGLLSGAQFLTGEVLTAADLAVYAQLSLLNSPTMPSVRARVQAYPALLAWAARVDAETRGPYFEPFV